MHLQERIRQTIRMEYRRQNVEKDVENYKIRRKFKEEQVIISGAYLQAYQRFNGRVCTISKGNDSS